MIIHPRHNQSLTQIADQYGAVCADIRGLELRRDALKATLIMHAGDAAEVFGAQFKITISHATRNSVSTALNTPRFCTIGIHRQGAE